ncbi:MAG: hypothetical protein H5T50_04370, partial [Nitrososphaeria archaeon]|nr:hypothetical protein [Nitrososphaeria archaeon]
MMKLEGRRRYPLSLILLTLVFTLYSIVRYFEEDPAFALFIWFTLIIGCYATISFMELRGIFLNQKILLTLILLITLGGGILVNIYIFSANSSFSIRIFSMGMFILIITV